VRHRAGTSAHGARVTHDSGSSAPRGRLDDTTSRASCRLIGSTSVPARPGDRGVDLREIIARRTGHAAPSLRDATGPIH